MAGAMSDLTERLRREPVALRIEAADRIEELEAALRVIAEECVSTGGEYWTGTAEVPPVFQQMYDDLAGGDTDE